ncbi:MAG TPA: hypothetical protein VGC96_02390 [Candidatus Elarobacter sp.]
MRTNRPGRLFAAVVAAAISIAAAPQEPPSSPTPADALFMAAREARSQSGYAHYSTYTTVVRYHNGGAAMTRHWATVEDMRRRIVHARAVSQEEIEHPHVPHGVNVGVGIQITIGGSTSATRTLNPESDADPIGQLSFAIDQDFGLALNAPPISASNDMSVVTSSAVALPRIGRTGTIVRTYEVTDLGDVVSEGATLHHLGLRPLREPRRFRLRELWTVPATGVTVRAVVAGIGNRNPLQSVRWQVDFVQLQGGSYVARETALEPLDYGSAGLLRDVTIAFERVHPTNLLDPAEQIGLSDDVGTTDP